MKILNRILKDVKINGWRTNLTVNLRGVRKSGVIFKSMRQALESHFDCKFTWCAQVWGDCQEHIDKHWKAILNVSLRGVRKSGVIFKSIRQGLERHFD